MLMAAAAAAVLVGGELRVECFPTLQLEERRSVCGTEITPGTQIIWIHKNLHACTQKQAFPIARGLLTVSKLGADLENNWNFRR